MKKKKTIFAPNLRETLLLEDCLITGPQIKHKMVTECARKSPQTTKKLAKNQLGPDNNPYLAQIITPEKAKLGPDSTYIYTYIHLWYPRTINRKYM